MKILIVDDHADMRRMMKHVIAIGIGNISGVTECDNGEEAVSLYYKLKPDCVLMDIELDTMSGFEAVEKIMQFDAGAKVVMVTGHNNPLFKTRAEELKVQGFVSKDKLIELVPILNTLSK
ncbi:response regulator transcription factor [Gracilimonas sp.]|uniref:response regulator transcription factor n=1 Tax=Gracilimonas sp. TaxID=1974203 RepID=UPI003BAB1ABC